MGMTIEEHIGVIEDLKSTMSVCMSEPEKTEICTSLSEAISTMRKYKKIEKLYKKYLNDMVTNIYADRKLVKSLSEVMEDGECK